MSRTVTVTVNGAERAVAGGTTLAALVAALPGPPTGVAVAVNDAVVRRADWAATTLRDRDRVEVLTAVQGG